MKKVIPSVVIASVLLCACANDVAENNIDTSALISSVMPDEYSVEPYETQETEPTEVFTFDDQLAIIAEKKDVWFNEDPEGMLDIKYAISDLNDDGLLEMIVASEEATTRYTFYYVYEVNAGATDLEMLEDTIIEPDSFPDIIMDYVDVYTINDVNYYAVTDYAEDCELKTFLYVMDGMIQHIPVAYFVDGKYYNDIDEEIDQETFDNAYYAYYDEEPTLTRHFVWVDGSDFDVSSTDAIVEQLNQMVG